MQFRNRLHSQFIKYLVPIALAGVLAACGGGGGGGGDGGPTSLASGTFRKTYMPDVATDIWLSPFTTMGSRHYLLMYQAGQVNGSGEIDVISFRVNSAVAAAVTCPNVTIRMGHTVSAQFTDATFATYMENGAGSMVTVVDNSTVTIPVTAAGEIFGIPLANTFHYNGVNNLLVEIIRSPACSGDVLFRAEDALATNNIIWTDNLASPTGAGPFNDHFHAEFRFAGGDNNVLAADRVLNNANTIAPTAVGRTQYLILAGDIDGQGPVTGIQFKLAPSASAPLSMTYSVTLSHVPIATTALGFTFANNVGSNPTVVADGLSVTVPAGATEFWLPLTGSFNFTIGNNLLVDVAATAVTNPDAIAYQNTAGQRIVWNQGDPAATTGTTLGPRGLEPRLRFHGSSMDVITAPTNSGTPPFGTDDSRMHMLFEPSALGTQGSISRLAFRLNANSVAASYPGYKVVLAQIASPTLSSTFANNLSGASTVFTGTFQIPAGLKARDWIEIPLTSQFSYDPTKYLVVETSGLAGTSGNAILGQDSPTRYPSHMAFAFAPGANTSAMATSNLNIQVDGRFWIAK